MVMPVIHDVFRITHQVSINYITLNPVVRVGLREDEVSFIPGSLISLSINLFHYASSDTNLRKVPLESLSFVITIDNRKGKGVFGFDFPVVEFHPFIIFVSDHRIKY